MSGLSFKPTTILTSDAGRLQTTKLSESFIVILPHIFIVLMAVATVSEADPVEGKISNDSPVGAALLGKKAGDVVEVQTPDGTREYTVMEIFK